MFEGSLITIYFSTVFFDLNTFVRDFWTIRSGFNYHILQRDEVKNLNIHIHPGQTLTFVDGVCGGSSNNNSGNGDSRETFQVANGSKTCHEIEAVKLKLLGHKEKEMNSFQLVIMKYNPN